MKKTLFLTHAGAPGGAEFKMMELCERQGDKAEVLLFQNGPIEDDLKRRNIKYAILPMPEKLASFRREDGVKAIFRAIGPTLSLLKNLARIQRQYGTIVAMSQKAFFLSALVRPFTGAPLVWFMNDIISREHFSAVLIRLCTALSWLTTRHVVLVSQASMDAWLAAGGRRKNVHIIHSGPNADVFAAALEDKTTIDAYRQKFSPDGAPLIGTFGRISHWKGQDVFLDAMAQVPRARAVIVGDALFGEEAYDAKVRARAAQPDLQGRVVFAGHINDVPKAMAACDVVVHCATAPEPFGRVIAEAMLAGRPSIASDAGGAREVVQNGISGQLTPMGDAKALAAAIQAYLDRPDWAKDIAAAGQARARAHYTADAMAEKFMNILAQI